MSWHPSPVAGSSSNRPTKRICVIKIEDDDDQQGSGANSPSNARTERSSEIKSEDDDEQQSPIGAVNALQAVRVQPTPPSTMNDSGVELAMEQKAAVNAILGGSNVFLTGCAGSGKTKALQEAIRQLRDRGKRVRVAAPTGKAAHNLGGTTLHSLFGLTPKKMERTIGHLEAMVEGSDALRKRLADADVLIIDEISMVEKIFFERLSRLMQAAKDNDECFGGVQLVVCGDFHQLPPVKPFGYCFSCGTPGGKAPGKQRDRDRKVTIYMCSKCGFPEDESMQWAFCSQVWRDAKFVNIYLRENHRQNEEAFVTCLRKIGWGETPNQAERDMLFKYPRDVPGAVYLYAKNADVDAMNNAEFDKLNGAQVRYQCVDDFEWKPHHPEFKDFGTLSKDGWTMVALTDHPYKQIVQLKVGMPVVLRKNINVADKLSNGSQGFIVGFQTYNEATLPRTTTGRDELEPWTGDNPEHAVDRIVVFRGADSHYYRQNQIKDFSTRYNIGKALPVVQFPDKQPMTIFPDCSVTQLGDEPPYTLLSRTQIPLDPGWAMTVHKAQGSTMDKVVVDLTGFWCAGQAYVALSRVKSISDIKVEGNEKGLDAAGAIPEVTEFLATTTWFEG